jgi:hypothetical protein
LAHGLEQISDMRVELKEMQTSVEELAQNVAEPVVKSVGQERGLDRPATTVIEEVLIADIHDRAEEAEPF